MRHAGDQIVGGLPVLSSLSPLTAVLNLHRYHPTYDGLMQIELPTKDAEAHWKFLTPERRSKIAKGNGQALGASRVAFAKAL